LAGSRERLVSPRERRLIGTIISVIDEFLQSRNNGSNNKVIGRLRPIVAIVDDRLPRLTYASIPTRANGKSSSSLAANAREFFGKAKIDLHACELKRKGSPSLLCKPSHVLSE